ncbi:SDR family NAD(P)-dependent oxidoreductase [Parabacteroides sp. FAFU027]|uniref:SDR family NAD(P)-dependent oxidoreductase n=1 Tax=Parabacteroides sp. FAFU027 TaxID=2922715 RepID=UPI001FAEDA0F|nr:SDR family oxidoreductase [Parabacteroides sp. FAFU027]
MNTKQFENKVVLVTGASRGIGNEIARQYAHMGASIIIADIQPAKKDFPFEFIHTNVGEADSVKALFSIIKERYKQLNILINNAGISIFTPFEELSLENWDKVINTNLRSVFLCSQAALPLMKEKGGKIVNIASTRAFMSEANTEAYSASKGGIIALTHALSVSLSKHQIQVNSISPGWIETGNYEALRKEDHAQHPSNRVGKPTDIARACLFLTSPENDFINGTNLTIDGGMTIKMIYEE